MSTPEVNSSYKGGSKPSQPTRDDQKPGHSRGGRLQRSRQRAQQGRELLGQKVMQDLEKKLEQRLFLDTLRKFDNMTISVMEYAVNFPVTTRGFGFIIYFLYSFLITNLNRNPITERCSINRLYRVAMCMFEYRMTLVAHEQRTTVAVPLERKWINLPSQYRDVIRGFTAMFGPIAQLINSFGNTQVMDVQWYPVIPLTKRPYLTVLFTNLRELVVQLSDANTDILMRSNFRVHNPIPGAIWTRDANNGFLLANPDQIMPAGYDSNALRDDVLAVTSLYNWTTTKLFSLKGEVKFDTNGSKSQLVSCKTKPWHVECDLNGPRFSQFTTNTYWSRVALTPMEMTLGAFILAGEIPPTTGAVHWPVNRRREGSAREVAYDWGALAAIVTA